MKTEAPRLVVDQQAEDPGLWFIATTASEAYLQTALRRLHAAIGGDAPEEYARREIARLAGII